MARLRRNLRTASDDASRVAASARRSQGRGADGPGLDEGPALIVPVDSEPGSAPKPPGDGPFDATKTGT